MVDITPILQAAVELLAALVMCLLIPWIRARTTAEQQKNADEVIATLVLAAEQIYGSKTGQEKKEYVRRKLAENGIEADDAEIESAVWKHINSIRLFAGEAVETLEE